MEGPRRPNQALAELAGVHGLIVGEALFTEAGPWVR